MFMVIFTIFIIIMCISCFACFGISYLANDRKIDENVCGCTIVFGVILGILAYAILNAETYEDISAKLISKNKISRVFEVEYEKFGGLVYGNKTENIQKFTTSRPSGKLKYNDRYFILMKLAGQDISKYADINGNEVIYRITPLQEMEEK